MGELRQQPAKFGSDTLLARDLASGDIFPCCSRQTVVALVLRRDGKRSTHLDAGCDGTQRLARYAVAQAFHEKSGGGQEQARARLAKLVECVEGVANGIEKPAFVPEDPMLW